MCSICGGTKWDNTAEMIWRNSRDRGRDDHGKIILPSGHWIGNHRATPTTEIEIPAEKQPVGNDPHFVFNGIIANDKELGIKDGEADTSVLPRILDLTTLSTFHQTLNKIVGSYAIACLKSDGRIFLAVNYKPIWIAEFMGQFYFSSLKAHFPSLLRPWKMGPYSVMEFGDINLHTRPLAINRMQATAALVICSSGLDSTAVAAFASSIHSKITLLHFDYSCQAGKREKEQIPKIAKYLGVEYRIMNISGLWYTL